MRAGTTGNTRGVAVIDSMTGTGGVAGESEGLGGHLSAMGVWGCKGVFGAHIEARTWLWAFGDGSNDG